MFICKSMLLVHSAYLLLHVHAACPSCVSILYVYSACQWCMSIAECPCCLHIIHVHFARPFCMPMLHFHATCSCLYVTCPSCIPVLHLLAAIIIAARFDLPLSNTALSDDLPLYNMGEVSTHRTVTVYYYYEIQIHKALCEFAAEKGYCWLKEGLLPRHILYIRE
jgi:hypothetical protein